MDESLPPPQIEQEDTEKLTKTGEDRRNIAKAMAAIFMIGPQLVSKKSEANTTIIESPQAHGGYPGLINAYRRQFGTRQDYQQGFAQATQNSNQIFELLGGFYGVLDKNPNSNNIQPSSIHEVNTAGFLHATRSTEDSWNKNTGDIWRGTGRDLRKQVRDIIASEYPEYTLERGGFFSRTWLLDAISNPVVTLKNLQDKQLEMFLRIPKPGTEEFHRLATKNWDDHRDQGKLKHDHPFHTKYNPTQSLYENLHNFYGPELKAIKKASQVAKNHLAVSIDRIDRALNNQLSATQKSALNDWLNVTGTQYEIQ